MLSKQQIPFIRILLFFIIGIFIADMARDYGILLYLFPFIICTLIVTVVIQKWGISWSWLPGLLLMLSMSGIGYTSYILHSNEYRGSYIGASVEDKLVFEIEVKENPKEGKRWRFISSVEQLVFDDSLKRYASGNVLIYLDTTDLEKSIKVGDRMIISAKLFQIRENSNPDVFDYKSYLYYRDVNLQSYISKLNILDHRSSTKFSVYLWTQQWREKLHFILKKYLHDKNHLAIAEAMLLGIKNNVDAVLYDSFTNSGAVHVLAVSGLHVGFVAMILYFLLGLIPLRSVYFRNFKTILIVISIFLYGMMTGMAPAIMRATIMYSVFIIAKAWRPATKNFNLLAFSAFIMLLYNPFMLFQAGFQFSYLAIWGIMAFYQPIRKMVFVKSNILSYLLDMISVSLAAQILVFPVTIYYFHKFPTYFFISGLLAIPAAAVIISLGMLLIGFHFLLPVVNEIIIAPLLDITLEVLIKGIAWINYWPMASIDGIFINKFMMIFIYVIIALTTLYKMIKKKLLVFTSLIVTIFLLAIIISHKSSFMNNQDFIVYDSYKNTCIDFFIQDRVYNLRSEKMKPKDLKFLTYNHRMVKAVRKVIDIDIHQQYKDDQVMFQDGFLQVGTKLFYFSFDNNLPMVTNPIHLDFLIIAGKSSLPLKKYIEHFSPSQIVVDHSIDKKQLRLWKKEVINMNTDVYFIEREGVFKGVF